MHLPDLGSLLTPQNPAVAVIVSALCPRGQILVMDLGDLEIAGPPEGAKVVVTPTEKVGAEIRAAVEGAGLELVPPPGSSSLGRLAL